MKCAGCGKGLLAKDREAQKCSRCNLWIGAMPPDFRFWKPEAIEAYKAGRVFIPPSMKPFDCFNCAKGECEECQKANRMFCQCARTGHNRSEEDEEFEDFVL